MTRLTDNELEALLNDLESDRAERKESWVGDAPEKGPQAVCASANDLPNHQKPGVLFVGVDDKGAPKNIAVTDQLLLTLADLKSNGNILPPPTVTVAFQFVKIDEAVAAERPKACFIPAWGNAPGISIST